MIVTGIEIEKLHGKYDYTVRFDNTLTFLYGENGCGKTTVLNMLVSVVTGKLYHLADYCFEKIVLSYKKENNEIAQIIIRIDAEDTMSIIFGEQFFSINNSKKMKESFYLSMNENEKRMRGNDIDDYFQEAYPLIREIKETFNYVYLPLNRFDGELHHERYLFSLFRRNANHLEPSRNTYLNDSLAYVEALVKRSSETINLQISKKNDLFRNEILEFSVQTSAERMHEILKSVMEKENEPSWDEMLVSKADYIRTLDEIGLSSGPIKKKVEAFFDRFEQTYKKHTEKGNEDEIGITLEYTWQYAEWQKVEKIAALARKYEQEKVAIKQPIEQFIKVINHFFENDGINKKIDITDMGHIVINSDSGKLKLSDLSSGEKQLMITFANLIFGLKEKAKGLYIVDEPEASLHLSWQAKFVDSILQVNDNVQLIFATHSPEIIGKYRENAVKLVRMLNI